MELELVGKPYIESVVPKNFIAELIYQPLGLGME